MNNSKRILCTVIGAMFTLGASQVMAVTTLKLSHNHSRDHAVHKAMTQFADEVRQKQTVMFVFGSIQMHNWATSGNRWN